MDKKQEEPRKDAADKEKEGESETTFETVKYDNYLGQRPIEKDPLFYHQLREKFQNLKFVMKRLLKI